MLKMEIVDRTKFVVSPVVDGISTRPKARLGGWEVELSELYARVAQFINSISAI